MKKIMMIKDADEAGKEKVDEAKTKVASLLNSMKILTRMVLTDRKTLNSLSRASLVNTFVDSLRKHLMIIIP